MRKTIDFNCDLGEGCGNDAEIIPLISSASIACGGHAGDKDSMLEALRLCRDAGVTVGAHPSFVDRENFGRKRMDVDALTLESQLTEQIRDLSELASETGVKLSHVKPHGALYNLAATDAATADVILDAVANVNAGLTVFGLAGSVFIDRARERGFKVAQEAFVERGYAASGQLAPRGTAGAVLETAEESILQLQKIMEGYVNTVEGTRHGIHADTVCLHGDRADAIGFAQALRAYLRQCGVEVKSGAST